MCKPLKTFHYIQLLSKAVVISTALLFCLVSCEESTGAINGSLKDSIVSTRLFNAHFTLKDSGYEKVIVRSPKVEMYELLDTPFTIFPLGLELNFYKTGSKKPGYLRASFAKIIEKKQWYEAKGNVIVVNDEGDSLKTQQLFWNQKTKKIFTPDTTFIIRKDGSFLPSYNGMEASDDFKSFKFFNNHEGRIFVEDK